MKTETQQISLFKSATSTKQIQISIQDYFKGIIEGKWQDDVIGYRTGKKPKEAISAITASGLFSGRKDSDLTEHSGLLVIDIDDKDQSKPISEIKNQLREIPEIFAIHASLGGKGLAIYFKINKAKHFESFEAITKMLINDYEIIPDMHCSNIGRLRFVSYDPDCHLNFGVSSWSYFDKKENRTSIVENKYQYQVFSDNDIDYILKQIQERGINIAPDYYSWLRIGFGIASKYGESGREYFRFISSYYNGKQKTDPDKQYTNCLKSDKSKSGGISIKSLFYYAKLAGCNITSERTTKIKGIAKIRRKQENQNGESPTGKKDARKYLEEFEGITGKDVDEVLDQIWNLPTSELKEEKESLLSDIEIFLKSNYKLKVNEITRKVEIDGEELNDTKFNSIYIQARRVISDKINKELVYDLIHSDFISTYNPIMDFFEKYKELKSDGNIDNLASCIDSDLKLKDANFVRYFLEKWLLSIIASAHGIYSILCLVLTGQEQGTGKTNFFREILPEQLRWLFAQSKLDGRDSDIAKLMCVKWIILDDEFGGKSKIDEKRFKELISTDIFTVRMPYGRYHEDMKRLAVLCGSTNDEKVINDLTGNRRIIPIQVNFIDEKKYHEVDKTKLFIELYWKFRENPRGWFLTKEDIDRLNEICFDAQQVSPEMELPLKYYEKTTRFDPGSKFLSSSEIRSKIEQLSGIKLSQQKLSIALKKIGYDYDTKRVDGQQLRGFWIREKFSSNQPEIIEDKLPF